MHSLSRKYNIYIALRIYCIVFKSVSASIKDLTIEMTHNRMWIFL